MKSYEVKADFWCFGCRVFAVFITQGIKAVFAFLELRFWKGNKLVNYV